MGRFFTLLFLLCASVYSAAASISHTASSLLAEPEACFLKNSARNLSVLSDTTPPVITCPPNVTLAIQSTNCDTAYTFTVTAEDDEPGVIVAQVSGIHSGEPFPTGTTTILYVAIDASGNTSTCSFTVYVTPAPGPPTITCKAKATVLLGANCSVSPTADALLEGAFGCPDGYTVEADLTAPFGNGPWVPGNFGASDRNKTYQFRVTDKVTQNRCWGDIKIVDSLPPMLECPTINVPCALPLAHLAPTFLKDSLGIAGGMPIVIENCPGNPNLSFVDVSTNLPCDSPGIVTGYVRRFWTALDAANNVATCVQVINRTRSLDDILFPVDATVSCAQPDTLPSNTGEPYAQVGTRKYGVVSASFCELDAFYDDSIETLCGGGHRIRRTWTVQDACLPTGSDNPVFGVQYIDVMDQDGPVLQCPPGVTIVAMAQNCMATINLPDIVVSDGCSTVDQVKAFWISNDAEHDTLATLEDFPGNNLNASDTLAVFGEVADYPVGATSVLYVATDVCGNTSSCEINLQVWDGVPPTTACDTFLQVYLNEQGLSAVSATMPDNGSTDDCSELHFKVRRTEISQCPLADTTFNDQVLFCCADANDTLDIVLRVYDVPVQPGAVLSDLATGQFSDCTVKVLVLDTNEPDCTAPADTVLTCMDFDLTQVANFGDPTYSCKVDSMVEFTNYSQFDTSCHTGVILRVFHVFDQAGGSGQCSQQITVKSEQNYWVKFPDDVVVMLCDSASNYGAPEFSTFGCENMFTSYTDEVFNVVPDACYKIERTWLVYNVCTYDPDGLLLNIPNPNPNAVTSSPDNLPGPVVSPADAPAPWAPSLIKISPTDPAPTNYAIYWDAHTNAYRYKQIVKVIDIQDPEVTDCPSGLVEVQDMTANDPQAWNESYWYSASTNSHDLCEAPVDLCITATDLCAGANLNVLYLLFLDLNGDGTRETVVNSNNLPGFNTVSYDNAGNPNYAGGIARQFDERIVPANQKYGFALETSISGRNLTACVRWNTQQSPKEYSTPVLPYGSHRIKWYITDACGNETICDYDFTIEDAVGLCAPSDIKIHGVVKTETGEGVSKVALSLLGTHPVLPPFSSFALTDDNGAYDFTIPAGADFTIEPYRDDDPLNGVSTFDLLLINKHVLGLAPLGSPYKIIGADANHSNSVTTFDVVEFRKLLLGIYQQLPDNSSWRFVPSDFVFPNPLNPFQAPFPESISVTDLQPDDIINYNFVGLKVGDENGNAIPVEGPQHPEDRGELSLEPGDAFLRPGETARIPVRLPRAAALAGLQFALQFDPEALKISGVELNPRLAGKSGADFYAQPRPGLLTFSWDNQSAPQLAAGEPVFYLNIGALQPTQLSRALQLQPERLQPEIYLSDGGDGGSNSSIYHLNFDFSSAPKVTQTEIFPAVPNPSAGPVYIPVALPEAATVRVELYDITGRQVYTVEYEAAAGLQRIVLPAEALGQEKGILSYRVQAGAASAAGKLVRW